MAWRKQQPELSPQDRDAIVGTKRIEDGLSTDFSHLLLKLPGFPIFYFLLPTRCLFLFPFVPLSGGLDREICRRAWLPSLPLFMIYCFLPSGCRVRPAKDSVDGWWCGWSNHQGF